MLTRKQIEDTAGCRTNKTMCLNCSLRAGAICTVSTTDLAKTALLYRDMLKRLEFSATLVYDAQRDFIADKCCPICSGQCEHEPGCELATLLKEE